jgi:hypothetical protein
MMLALPELAAACLVCSPEAEETDNSGSSALLAGRTKQRASNLRGKTPVGVGEDRPDG